MLRLITLVSLPVLLISTGCPVIDVDNPAQALSRAELSGNLVVFTYFAANRNDVRSAQRYLVAIETLEANISNKPDDGGFTSLTDLVHKKLEEKLAGEDAAFLPGAKSLTRILLLQMDQKLKMPKVEPSEEIEILLDIVKAFLKGAKTAVGDFIPN